MNCQNFETNVPELARGLLMDAATREAGLAHADSCARCRARLAVERALDGGLRAVARSAENENAPARVESALVAAFRARRAVQTEMHAAQTNAPHVASENDAQRAANVLPASFTREASANNARSLNEMQRGSTLRFPRTGLRAAAAAVLIFCVAGLAWMLAGGNVGEQTRETARTSVDAAAINAAQQTRSDAPATPAPENGDALASANSPDLNSQARESRDTVSRPAAALASINTATGRRQNAPESMRANARAMRGGVGYSNARYDSRRGAAQGADASLNQGEAEITTDFFPLAGASELTATDGGHVVRVELPRSALVSFGLPVNVERTGGRVKADVLLGDDGVARAVRFVR
ncbi:MAG TPA: hypothetical protein VNA19_12865 [Pyrinomonadaceae bacterium]|jgi:hypothetical protein|nr:hypothetical protein [Pyrinomonadaceae bacterium]